MTLTAWLIANEVSDADFADRIGVSRQTLWRYKETKRIPHPKILSRISAETTGCVTANDFFAAQHEVAA